MSPKKISQRFIECAAGATAVEFALIAPVFLALIFGVVAYSMLMMTYSGVQQLTAESARATVAGLTDDERDELARAFISTNVAAYPLLDPSRLTVATAVLPDASHSFRVTLVYDMSGSVIDTVSKLVPVIQTTITRSAVVQGSGQ